MEVILTKDVENLGNQYTVVKVKPGYARNYLIPRGFALNATGSNVKSVEEIIKQRAHKEAKLKDAAEATAVKLKDIVLQIPAKVGETGKIFGSVNSIQIAEALSKLGYTIDRKSITIKEEHIKTIGTYIASLRLTKDNTVDISFEVVAE
jgi:large subunit ribosomal protein L9